MADKKMKKPTDKQMLDWVIEIANWANEGTGKYMTLECLLSRKAITAAMRADRAGRK